MISFHTTVTREANRITQEEHTAAMRAVMAEVETMLDYKGQDYDNLRTFVERMVFGDYSWATLLFIKSDRLCSTLMPDTPDPDKIDDCLIDLIVYAIAYRAWRNMTAPPPEPALEETIVGVAAQDLQKGDIVHIATDATVRPAIPRRAPVEKKVADDVIIPPGTPVGEIAAKHHVAQHIAVEESRNLPKPDPRGL
jgi:hypothetical protein